MQAIKRINFDKEYGILLFLEIKTSTLRLEKKAEKDEIVILTLDEKDFAEARITEVLTLKLSNITESVAREDGFLSVSALKKALKKYYPDTTDETIVYQIKFSIQKILDISLIEKDIVRLCDIIIRHEALSTDEKELIISVLNEGIEHIPEDLLDNVREVLKRAYLDLIS